MPCLGGRATQRTPVLPLLCPVVPVLSPCPTPLPPDFPSWPLSTAGSLPALVQPLGTLPRLGRAAGTLPPFLCVPAENRGRGQAGRPHGRVWERGQRPGAPPTPAKRGRSPLLPHPEELAPQEQRHGESGTPSLTFSAAPGPLSSDTQLDIGGLTESAEVGGVFRLKSMQRCLLDCPEVI